jgi:hypothetical protein
MSWAQASALARVYILSLLYALRHLSWPAAIVGLISAGTLAACAVIGAVAILLSAQAVLPRNNLWLALGLVDVVVVFLVFLWLWAFLFHLQRRSWLNVRVLLLFPIHRRVLYILHLLGALCSAQIMFILPALAALCYGFALHCDRIGVLLAGTLAFLGMLLPWTDWAQTWLATWGKQRGWNGRRLGISLVLLVVFMQVPHAVVRALENSSVQEKIRAVLEHPEALEPYFKDLLLAHTYIPLGWFPLVYYHALRGDAYAAILPIVGMCAMAALGCFFGYRAYLEHLFPSSTTVLRRFRRSRHANMPLTLAMGRKGEQDQTLGLVSALFLDWYRTPALRTQFLMIPVVMVIFLSTVAVRYSGFRAEFAPHLAYGMTVFTLMGYVFVLCNVCGFDAAAFRALSFFPFSRYRFLLAAHLALFPAVGVTHAFLLVLAYAAFGVPIRIAALSMLLLPALYFLVAACGMFISVYFPLRISREPLVSGMGTWIYSLRTTALSGCVLSGALGASVVCTWGGQRLGVALSLPDAAGPFLGVSLLWLAAGALYPFLVRRCGDVLTARYTEVLEELRSQSLG